VIQNPSQWYECIICKQVSVVEMVSRHEHEEVGGLEMVGGEASASVKKVDHNVVSSRKYVNPAAAVSIRNNIECLM
jgi:hypothetical protein